MALYQSTYRFEALELSETNRDALMAWGINVDNYMVLDTMTVIRNTYDQMIGILDNADFNSQYEIAPE